jgi:hypothetical protein
VLQCVSGFKVKNRRFYIFGPAQKHLSGKATSMIGPCQEAKSSPDALRRSAGVSSFRFFAACVGFSAVVPSREEPDFHLLAQLF